MGIVNLVKHMNILQRITKLEIRNDNAQPQINALKDRIEKLEEIIESLGYYIPKK
jgi:hypothetical protein